MEFDRFHQDAEGRVVPLFKMMFRIEIARSEFTYVNAMNKIIELNDEYKFDWIAVDRGYGRKFAVIGQDSQKTYDYDSGKNWKA